MKKIGESVPYYSGMVEPSIRKFFGNVSLDCPFKPGRYYAMNMPDNASDEKKTTDKFKPPQYNPFDVPNGEYRCTIELSTNEDSNAFFMQWQLEKRIRTSDDKF